MRGRGSPPVSTSGLSLARSPWAASAWPVTLSATSSATDGVGGQVGEAGRSPLLDVTGSPSPRPTFAFCSAARLPQTTDVGGWVPRSNATDRPGTHLRVLAGRVVAAGNVAAVLLRPGHGAAVSALALAARSLPLAHTRALLTS